MDLAVRHLRTVAQTNRSGLAAPKLAGPPMGRVVGPALGSAGGLLSIPLALPSPNVKGAHRRKNSRRSTGNGTSDNDANPFDDERRV